MNYKLKSLETEWNEDAGLQQMRPITEYHKDIKKQCITMDMRFLSYLVDDTGYEEIQSAELYKKYCEWFDKGNYKTSKFSITTFGSNMSNTKGITKRKSNYIIYNIDRQELRTYLQINDLYDDTAYIN
jgi:hypothetical protein